MIRARLLRSIALAEAGRPAEARAELDAAVSAEPHLASLRLAAATVRFVLRDYQEAMAELTRAIEIAPGAASAATAMTIDFARRLGWYREALAAIDRALAAEPRRPALHVMA